jgi:hypothetical protein
MDGIDSSYIVFTGTNEGPSSKIVMYDNGSLRNINRPTGLRRTSCIRVVSRNEIYLCGADGVQRYNGTDWEWMLDSTNSIIDNGWALYIIDLYKFPDSRIQFISLSNIGEKTVTYNLWEYSGSIFSRIDSFTNKETDRSKIRFGYQFWRGEDGVYSTSSGGVFKWQNSGWLKIHDHPGAQITGKANNLFSSSNFDLWHYNGSTWEDILPQLTSIYPNVMNIKALYYIDDVIFVSTSNGYNTVVFRGRQEQ